MKHSKKTKMTGHEKRARRIRKKIHGTAERPRLSVYRSLKGIYAQLIDDDKGVSILGVSSTGPDMKKVKIEGPGKIVVSTAVGTLVAEKAKALGIQNVVFDRNGFLYHGRMKAVAEGARKGGLIF